MAAEFERQQAAERAATYSELINSGELSGLEIDDWMHSEGISEEELGSLAEARYKEAIERAKAQSEIERRTEAQLIKEIEEDTLAQEAQDLAFDKKQRPHVYVDEQFKPTYDAIREGYKKLGLDPSLAKDVEAVGDIDLAQYGVEGTTTEPLMIREPKGGRTRIGTEVRNFDGMKIVVPSTDPVTGKALTLFEGSKQQAPGSIFGQDLASIDHASEYTQRQLARRMGRKFQMNNGVGVTNTDFTEGNRLIDGQIQEPQKTTQLFTQLDPIETPVEDKYSRVTPSEMDARSETVARRVLDAIDENPDKSIYDIVTELSDPSNPERTLKGGWTRENPGGGGAFNGKAYSNRPDNGRPPRNPKDEIFYTLLDSRTAKANYKSHDSHSVAPKGVEIEDVEKASEWVDDLRGEDLKSRLSIHKNGRGNIRRDGSTTYGPKTFAELEFKPGDTESFRTSTQEIVKAKPATAQFLDYDGTSPETSGLKPRRIEQSRTVRRIPKPVTRQVSQSPQRMPDRPVRVVGRNPSRPLHPSKLPSRPVIIVPKGEGGFVTTPDAVPTARARAQGHLRGGAAAIIAPEVIAPALQGDLKGAAQGAVKAVAADTAIAAGGAVASRVAPQVVKNVAAPVLGVAGPTLQAAAVPDLVATVATRGKSTSAAEVVTKAGNTKAYAAAGLGPVSPAVAGPSPAGSMVTSPVNKKLKAEADQLTENRKKAIERGGRWKIGGVTIPEFGLSEVFGMNK